MASNAPLPNAPITVWVCPPVALNADGSTASAAQVTAAQAAGTPLAFYFPFSVPSAWRKEGALLPGSSEEVTRSMGTCQFRLLRQTRMDQGDNSYQTYAAVVEGCYVAIMEGTGQLSFQNNCLWKGWLPRIEGDQVQGTAEIIGTATAQELGHLLDRQQVVGWTRDLDGKGAYPESSPMQTPPTANMGNPTGAIIGNAVNSGSYGWLFARVPTQFGYAVPSNNGYTGTDLGKYWTRWRLLMHVVKNCVPKALCSSMAILCQDASQGSADPTLINTISGYLNQTQFPEVFDLRNLTWCGLLDILIPRERDMGWKIIPTDAGVWQIYIYSLAGDITYGVPAVPSAQQYAVTMANYPAIQVSIVKDATDLPDKIIVEGNPHVFCFTIGGPDLNFGVGWNESLNIDYFQAASTFNPTLYATLNLTQVADINRQYRAQPWLRDVFTRFAILPNANGDVQIPATPGMGNKLVYPACPQLAWNQTIIKPAGFGYPATPQLNAGLTFDKGPSGTGALISRMPYLGGVGMLRTLPLPLGFDNTLADLRAPQQKASPTYMPLRLFCYNPADLFGMIWRDLAAPDPLHGNMRPHVEADDRGAALHIEYSPRELLAAGIWPTDGSAVAADINPVLDIHAMNYLNLVATIAIESDQVVRVVQYRPGLKTTDDSQVRIPMRIVNRNLNLHAIWSNTIIGVTLTAPPVVSGSPIPYRITDSHMTLVPGSTTDGISFLRNDYGLADLICKQAAGFSFRPRRSIAITLMQPGIAPSAIPWATIGALIISTIESASVTNVVGTVVEKIVRTYGEQPRLQVYTSLPPRPDFEHMGVSASPVRGGPASASLGATPTQAIQAIRDDVIDLQQKTVKVPIFTQVPLSPTPLLRVKISGGQVVNGVSVIQYAADPFTADKVYNPLTDTSYIVGLGYGILYGPTGQPLGNIIIRHNFTQFTGSLIAGQVFTVAQPQSIAVAGGGTIVAYPVVEG